MSQPLMRDIVANPCFTLLPDALYRDSGEVAAGNDGVYDGQGAACCS
jgi:hypothetical protein